VDRSRVHRWLREDSSFQAAYNAAQRNLRREIEQRLLQLASAAADVVAAASQRGDLRAALAVLKGTGALAGSPPTIRSEDPAELAEEAEVADHELAAARLWRRMAIP